MPRTIRTTDSMPIRTTDRAYPYYGHCLSVLRTQIYKEYISQMHPRMDKAFTNAPFFERDIGLTPSLSGKKQHQQANNTYWANP